MLLAVLGLAVSWASSRMILALAQRRAEKIVADAQEQAREIRAHADEHVGRASSLISQSEERMQTLLDELRKT